jgi:hypothetical protein
MFRRIAPAAIPKKRPSCPEKLLCFAGFFSGANLQGIKNSSVNKEKDHG